MSNNPYEYEPSLAAAVIFTVAFGLTTAFHGYQLARWRTWYFIPFLVGGLFEILGYMIRTISISQKPDYVKLPYIMQTVFILLAPALYAASIYMVLGRIIKLVQAESYALIRPSWMTKIFVTGDVVSFVVQGAGGGMLSGAETKAAQDRGQATIVTGLFIQVIFFSLFIIVTGLFHRRIAARPTARSESIQVPWMTYIYVLYGVSVLVMIRSIFRTIEYIEGKGGELQSNEIYFYLLDTILMFFVSVAFNWYHPSTIITSGHHEDKNTVALGAHSRVPSQDSV